MGIGILKIADDLTVTVVESNQLILSKRFAMRKTVVEEVANTLYSLELEKIIVLIPLNSHKTIVQNSQVISKLGDGSFVLLNQNDFKILTDLSKSLEVKDMSLVSMGDIYSQIVTEEPIILLDERSRDLIAVTVLKHKQVISYYEVKPTSLDRLLKQLSAEYNILDATYVKQLYPPVISEICTNLSTLSVEEVEQLGDSLLSLRVPDKSEKDVMETSNLIEKEAKASQSKSKIKSMILGKPKDSKALSTKRSEPPKKEDLENLVDESSTEVETKTKSNPIYYGISSFLLVVILGSLILGVLQTKAKARDKIDMEGEYATAYSSTLSSYLEQGTGKPSDIISIMNSEDSHIIKSFSKKLNYYWMTVEYSDPESFQRLLDSVSEVYSLYTIPEPEIAVDGDSPVYRAEIHFGQ